MCSWIPLDVAARALCDVRNAGDPVVHLAHSQPVDCRVVVEAFSEELKLPIVSYAEWMKQLERFSADEMADGGIIGESK